MTRYGLIESLFAANGSPDWIATLATIQSAKRLIEICNVHIPTEAKASAKFERGELQRWVQACICPTEAAWRDLRGEHWQAYAWNQWAIRCVIVSWGLRDGIDASLLKAMT